MNYCIPNEQTTEKCECYNQYDMIQPPAVLQTCKMGQICSYISNYPVPTRVECLDVCAPWQTGPCACYYAENQYEYIYEGQVCTHGTPAAKEFRMLPVASSIDVLMRVSACKVKFGKESEWEVCDIGTCCGVVGDGIAKCLPQCIIDSVANEECFCRTYFGTLVLARQYEYCSEKGEVYEYTDPICPPRSFSNGKCKCNAKDASYCATGSVCVGDIDPRACVPACKRNWQNIGDTCVCHGARGRILVPNGGKCVLDLADAALSLGFPECADGQIGSCACRDPKYQGPPAHYFYTHWDSACFHSSPDPTRIVLPIAKYGTTANRPFACKKTFTSYKEAIICEPGYYCVEAPFPEIQCVRHCEPNMAALEACACADANRENAVYMKAGDYCGADGRIIYQQGELCVPNAISPGNCKCDANNYYPCDKLDFCTRIDDKQSCQPICFSYSNPLRSGCVCPYSSSSAMVPAGFSCACGLHNDETVCETIQPCEPQQIGPCACGKVGDNTFASNIQACQVCMENPDESKSVVLLCKSNVIANASCACKKDGKGLLIQKGQACMVNDAMLVFGLPECEIGVFLTYACACRVRDDGGAAVFCDKENTCKQDPSAPGQNVCWHSCSDSDQCMHNGTCFGEGSTARCVYPCYVGQIVVRGSECFCGAEQTPCKAHSACTKSEAPKCVPRCDLNAVNDSACYCMLDGAGASVRFLVSEPSFACVQTDAKMLQNDVVPLCTATLQSQCACRFDASHPSAVYTDLKQACVGDNGAFVFYEACERVSGYTTVCSCNTVYGAALCAKISCLALPGHEDFHFCKEKCEVGAEADRQCYCGTNICQKGQICDGIRCSGASALKSGAFAGNARAAAGAAVAAVAAGTVAAVAVVAVVAAVAGAVAGVWLALRRKHVKAQQQAQQNGEAENGQILTGAAEADN